jgi:hypothetical protein
VAILSGVGVNSYGDTFILAFLILTPHLTNKGFQLTFYLGKNMGLAII